VPYATKYPLNLHNLRRAFGHRSVTFRLKPMNALSPRGRADGALLRLSLLISVLAFFFLGSSVLLDQWIMGLAGAGFIFGTWMVIAGLCLGLFAIVASIGLGISAAFRDEPK
jgi:hypothetical protein